MNVVNVAVIGTGQFGVEHVKILTENRKACLKAICDTNKDRVKDVAHRFNIAKWVTEPEEIFSDPGIEAVVIATPEQTHFSLTKRAVEHGKHVLVEKPVCLTPTEGEKLRKLVKSTDRKIVPGHLLRYDASYCEVQRLLKSGESGQIISIKVKRNVPRERFLLHSRTHPVFMALSHDIDMVLWLTNNLRPSRVFAMERKTDANYKNPDVFFGLLELENGIICQLESQWTLPNEYGKYLEIELEVMTTKGHIRLQYPGNQLVVMNKGRLSYPDVSLWPCIHGRSTGALANQLDYFLDLVKDVQSVPVVTVEEAVQGINIGYYLIQSAKEKREIRLEEVDR